MQSLQSLKISLKRARVENFSGHLFVPRSKLLRIMCTKDVREALYDTSVERFEIDDIANVICAGGQRTFATLVLSDCPEAIARFISGDCSVDNGLDAMLPCDEARLRKLELNEQAVMDFCEHQWLFLAPQLKFDSVIPQMFHDRTVLPFLRAEDQMGDLLGSGGFGNVYAVHIPTDHQDLPFEIVRKEFASNVSRSRHDFEAERKNMGILKLVQHPNIVRLLGAYCHRGRYNFIFPRAHQGTLGELIQRDTRPKDLQSNTSLMSALVGLSSAICAVHTISSDKIRMIGCHRDLRLSNVLVDGSRFILADFGLSRFKPDSENSMSVAGMVHGDYVAPECEEADDGNATMQTIGRSSDIWSFGCLISEFVTYMLCASKGVKEFRDRRRKRIESFNLTHYRFYAPPQSYDPGVEAWLAELERRSSTTRNQDSKVIQGLIRLVREMLALSPHVRPNAQEVEARLRTMTIYMVSRQLLRDLDRLHDSSSSVHVLLEQRRLQAWLWASKVEGASIKPQFQAAWTGDSYGVFEHIRDHLLELGGVLETLIPDATKHRSRAFLPLRDLNDRLFSLLPESLQSQAREYAEITMLQRDDDLYLRTVIEEFRNSKSGGDLSALAKMKRMQVLTRKPSSKLDLKFRFLPQEIQRIGDLRVVESDNPDNTQKELLIVDTKKYDVKINDEFIRRLEVLAESLHSIEKPERYHLLHCRGFYHDTGRFSSSLVYDLPVRSPAEPRLDQIVALDTALMNSDQYVAPELGDKFRLAHSLSNSLLQFHKTAWLHRNIRSSNIIFFHASGQSWDPKTFSFVGLAYSRPNNNSVLTDGPPSSQEIDYYVDRRYLQTGRYQIENDYYALGILLLEIGLWVTLPAAFGNAWKDLTQENVQDAIMKNLVPRLGPAVGRMYRGAVERCLRGQFGAYKQQTEAVQDLAGHLGFATEVIEPLSKCVA